MGFRFRKSIKVLPGVKINLSKTGISTSLGRPGATINLKRGRKAKVTVGIPGSGLSHSSDIGTNEDRSYEQDITAQPSLLRRIVQTCIIVFVSLYLLFAVLGWVIKLFR